MGTYYNFLFKTISWDISDWIPVSAKFQIGKQISILGWVTFWQKVDFNQIWNSKWSFYKKKQMGKPQKKCCQFLWQILPLLKMNNFIESLILGETKVIHTKYSKHYPYTVAHTFECVCSKINHGLNHGLFISLMKLILCPIHWIVYV